MTPDVRPLGTVLGIWAHPDDETYLSGGLMARATEAGQRVVCVTATAGEVGAGPRADPELADVRRRELEEALELLGVREHHWLGHPDGGCPAVDPDAATAELRAVLAEVRPDTVVTFGADGFTGHPDHQAVGRWAAAAARASGPHVRLLVPARTAAWTARFASLHRRVGAFEDGLPVPVAERDLALQLDLDPHLLDRKVAALEAQPSQTRPVIDVCGPQEWRAWIATESFVVPFQSELPTPAEPVPAVAGGSAAGEDVTTGAGDAG